MKRKDFIKDWRAKSVADIEAELLDSAKTLMNHRFKSAVGQVTDSSEKKKLRRKIARLKTIQSEKQAVS